MAQLIMGRYSDTELRDISADDNGRLNINSVDSQVETTDFETISVSSTAVGLTEATIGSNKMAFVTVEDNNIRIRTDGTSPTSSVGHLIYDGEAIVLESAEELENFEAIAVSGDATLSVSYKAVV